MCFTCKGSTTFTRGEHEVEIRRVEDPLTQPTDFDMSASLLQDYSDGDWCFVGLRAVFHHPATEPFEATVYGVPEYGINGCALNNQAALDRAETSLMDTVATGLHENHALTSSPLP